jgi:polyisoprenoid-binding protein YceI
MRQLTLRSVRRNRGPGARVSLGACILLGAAGFVLAAPLAAALETYDIDAVHSGINFKVRHLFTNVPGRFGEFSGTLQYDAEKPQNSTIEIVIQAASIDTDNDRRDEHLRSADFLETETYPTITFKSTKIEPAEKANHYKVTGEFTLHGVTRTIVIDVELLGFGEFPGMGHRGGFHAATTINRQDFGVKWNRVLDVGGAVLGDEVHIECPIEVVRQDS